MTSLEIIALVVTAIGVLSFSIIFTILYVSYAGSTMVEVRAGKRDVDIIDDAIYDLQPGVKAQKKTIKIIKRVLFWLSVVIIVPLFIFSLYGKITNGVPMIGGRGIMVVASGSMSEKHSSNVSDLVGYDNQFQTYDIIVLEKVEKSSALKKYDVIAFVNDEGVNVIHRIVDVVYKADGVHYVTRGDANNGNDTYNPSFKDVIGRYTNQRIPLIGVFVMFLQSYSGIITLVAVIYCLIMIDRMTEKIHQAYAQREKILNDAMHFDEVFNVENVVTDFSQTIYYDGYAYVFSEVGLNSKYPISEEEQQRLLSQKSSEEQSENAPNETDEAQADDAPEDIPTNKDEEI